MKRQYLSLMILGLLAMMNQSHATDLKTVYQNAIADSPTLRSEQASANVADAAAQITGASLLPQVTLGAGVAENAGLVNSQTYSASITQTLFNVNTLESWHSSRQASQAAAATYQYQAQQFIFKVANDYFAVLQAQEGASFATAQLAADDSALKQTQEKFAVGLATLADVKQAQANYEEANATKIKNVAAIQTAFEVLRADTGQVYTTLAPLKENLPFSLPEPADMAYWVSLAKRSNWNLESQRLTTGALRSNVVAQYGSMLPSISLSASYIQNHYNGSAANIAENGFINSTDRVIAINATWDLFVTPALAASTGVSQAGNTALLPMAIQAQYNYEAGEATEDNVLRELVASIRQDYLNVSADVRSISAYQQSVVASQVSLDQYQAQYRVGTQTITAVLQQVQDLYEAKQNYAQAEYQYLKDLMQLKLDAGSLSVNDINDLNRWLQLS